LGNHHYSPFGGLTVEVIRDKKTQPKQPFDTSAARNQELQEHSLWAQTVEKSEIRSLRSEIGKITSVQLKLSLAYGEEPTDQTGDGSKNPYVRHQLENQLGFLLHN